MLISSALAGSSTVSAYRLDEVEPNNTVEDAQVLSGPLPLTVNGMAEVGDAGDLVYPFSDGTMDDIEDLYQITTTTERSSGST